MVQVNDEVLGEIGLDFGIQGQVPAGELLDTIQPTVPAELYRRIYRHLFLTATPQGGPGILEGFFDPGSLESWFISSGYSIVGVTGPLNVTVDLLDPLGKVMPVFRRVIGTNSSLSLVGGNGVFDPTFGENSIPASIIVPSGTKLRIQVAAVVPPITNAAVTIGFLAKVEPPVRAFSLKTAVDVTVP